MEKIRLGKTELYVTKTAFGCLPVQRCSVEDGVKLLRRAYESGINYFDTAHAYTDSEYKIGLALHDVRDKIVISTKTMDTTYDGCMRELEQSLKMLQTDYIDLYQFHKPAELPNPDDPNSAYAAAAKMKEQGVIRHIGITEHDLGVAQQAIRSGYFETLQFPFCYLTTEHELGLVKGCKEADMGFIAMKGLSGGLLTNAEACYAFMQQYDNVVPIWGIQREEELTQWLELSARNVQMTPELQAVIDKDRKELAGNFCRSCGYCLPCTAGIDIPQAARMAQLLRRSPYKPLLTEKWYNKMQKINDCVQCGLCASRCPYGLDTPKLLQEMLADYNQFYLEHKDD